MRVRIFHRQPFGSGGGIQSGICRYQYQRRNLCPDFQRRRQLHGIIDSLPLAADQRPASPIHRDVAEQPVLDLVPLARARREVTDGHILARPRPPSAGVHTSTAARCRSEPPPSAIISNRSARGYNPARHAATSAGCFPRRTAPCRDEPDVHPTGIVPADIVHPVGDRLPQVVVGEVVRPTSSGSAWACHSRPPVA